MSLTSEIRRHFGKDDEGGIKKIQEDIHKVHLDTQVLPLREPL